MPESLRKPGDIVRAMREAQNCAVRLGLVQNLRTVRTPTRSGSENNSCIISDFGRFVPRLLLPEFGTLLALDSYMTTEKEDDWRSLCRSVADETDPYRMSELLNQLIQKLDARKQTHDGSRRVQLHAPTFDTDVEER
jgi:hypothetical protein